MPQLIFNLVVGVLFTQVTSALFGKSTSALSGVDLPPPPERDHQETSRVASDRRKLILGEALIAGPVALFSPTGADNEFLHLVIPHADHPCEGIVEWLVNDESQIDETQEDHGAELSTNGDFATDTDWTKGTGWAIAAGVATHASGTGSDLEQNITIVDGDTYTVTYKITGRTAGTITAKIGGTSGATVSINTTIVEDIVAGAGGAPELEFTADSAFDGSIDKVSVKEVGGSGEITTGRFADHVRLVAHLGALDQAAAANLVSEVGEWTTAHKGGGVTYTEARLKHDQNVWPQGFNNISAVVRGAILYDPRDTGATITSSSAADPAVFTTAAAHGFAVGDYVWTKGHAGAVPAVDKMHQVATVPSTTTYTLIDEDGNTVALSTGGSGGTVTKMAWSDNWALCVRFMLAHRVGKNADNDEIDDTTLIAAANVSDEQVQLTVETQTFTADVATNVLTLALPKGWKLGDGMELTTTDTLPTPLAIATTYYLIRITQKRFKLATTLANARAGVPIDITDTGTGSHTLRRNSQLRYTCNGVVETGVGPQELFDNLMSAGAGVLTYDGDVFKLFAGAATAVTGDPVTESDLREEGLTVDPKLSFNATRGQFFDRDRFWGLVDAAPFTNATYEAEDGNQRIYGDFRYIFTSDAIAVQRLLKIALERNRQGATLPFPAQPRKYKTAVWDVETITLAHLGYSAKQFRVVKVTEQEDGGYDIEYREETDAIWDWNLGDETSVDLAPNTTLPNPFTVAPPTGMGLTTDSFITETGIQIDRIIVSWSAPLDGFVTSGGNIEIQFKRSADATFEPSFFVKGAEVRAFVAPVEDGVKYDVRIRSVNELSIEGAFVNVFSYEVGAPGAGVTVQKDYGFITDPATINIDRGGIAATPIKFLDYETIV